MRSISLSVLASVALAACGGGGGGSEPPPSGEALRLTSSNYVQAAQQVVSSGGFLADTGGVVNGADVQSAGGLRLLVDASQAVLRRAQAPTAGTTAVAVGAATTETRPCSGGGNVTLTMTASGSNGQPQKGDSAVIVASNCVEAGDTINGRLTVTYNSASFSGSGAFAFSVGMAMDNFSAVTSGRTVTGNGQVTMDADFKSLNSGSMTIGVPNLTLTATYGGTTVTQTLTNYTVRIATTPIGAVTSSSITFNGGFASSGLESRTLVMATPVPVVGRDDQTAPTSGQLSIAGANGSKVRVTVQPGGMALIELDADGNGSFETSTTKPWSELS